MCRNMNREVGLCLILIGLMDVDGIMVDILTIVDGVHKPTYESYD